MTSLRNFHMIPRERLTESLALLVLLILAGLLLIGPSGLLAWRENLVMLESKEAELKALKIQRQELKNRVSLLNPRHADPDLAGELVKRNLNVVHPDDMVMMLK